MGHVLGMFPSLLGVSSKFRHVTDELVQGNTIGTYGFTATVPSVIEELGYSAADAQLLTIPIW